MDSNFKGFDESTKALHISNEESQLTSVKKSPAKVLFIGEEQSLEAELGIYLSAENFTLKQYKGDVKGKWELLVANSDIIILDIDYLKLNTFVFLKKIRVISALPIIIVGSTEDVFERVYALESGADDYVQKSVHIKELLARIKANMRRVYTVGLIPKQKTLYIHDISLCYSRREVTYQNELVDMTGIEFELLYILMSKAGQIISKPELGKKLFNRAITQYDRSIDMHLCNVRKKLSFSGVDKYIKTVRGIGYIFTK